MKALLVNVGFVPQVGGSYRLLYEAARHLPAGSVEVLTSHCPGDAAFDRAQALPIRRSWAYTLRDPGALFGYLRAAWPAQAPRLEAWLSRLHVFAALGAPAVFIRTLWQVLWRRYDVLLAGQVLTTGWLAWLLRRLLGLRYGTFVYGEEVALDAGPRRWQQLLALGLSQADWVVACSEATRQVTVARGVPAAKTYTLWPAVDTALFCPQAPSPALLARYQLSGKKVLLSVGRLLERKGFDTVLQTLPALRQRFPDLAYVLRGEGPEGARLAALARQLGVADLLQWVTDLDYADLPGLYAAGDVFVMPNRTLAATGEQEGFGIVFLEASSCGKPVVGGRSGGAVDAIADGQTGWLVNPESVDELTDKLGRLLAEPELAARMGQAGRPWVIEHFSWDQYADRLWQLLTGPPEGKL